MKKMIFTLCAMLASATCWGQQLTIEQLFQKVKDNNATMKAQRSALEAAQEGVKVAKSQRLPDINANLSISYNGNGFITDRDFSNYTEAPIPHFGNNFGLEAQMAIYTGGAQSSMIRLAELGAEKTLTGLKQNEQGLCFMALGQYLDLCKIDNQLQVYHRNIALTQKLIDNVREKYNQGTALRNDITRYELQMEQLKLGLQKLTDNRTIINHRLCNTLGMSGATITPDTTEAQTLISDQQSLNTWQENATSSSLSLRQSQLDMDMARQQTRLAKSELLPKVALVAADNFNGPITIEVPPINKNFNYWYAGVGVKYSLSSLFKSNKAIKKARIAERNAADMRQVTAEQLDNDMQSAYTLYQQSFVDLKTQNKSVQLARQNYDVINSRYLNQLALVTDMVDAENMLLQAELNEVNARISVVYAYYKMKYVASSL